MLEQGYLPSQVCDDWKDAATIIPGVAGNLLLIIDQLCLEAVKQIEAEDGLEELLDAENVDVITGEIGVSDVPLWKEDRETRIASGHEGWQPGSEV